MEEEALLVAVVVVVVVLCPRPQFIPWLATTHPSLLAVDQSILQVKRAAGPWWSLRRTYRRLLPALYTLAIAANQLTHPTTTSTTWIREPV